MKVKVAKWGNSLGVRLPKAAIAAVGAADGTEFDLTVDGTVLKLAAPAKTSRDLFRDMISEMRRLGPEAESETIDWGPDRGSEIIDDAYSRGEITLNDIVKRAPNKKRGRSKGRS